MVPALKPANFTEIPRYLISLSSTLFKKATAAEIFMNRLEQKRKQQNKTAKKNVRNIIKIGENNLENQKRENMIMNLISEPSSVQPVRGRRKSIEVLMKDKVISGVETTSPLHSRLNTLPGQIKGPDSPSFKSPPSRLQKPALELGDSNSKSQKNTKGLSDLNSSFKSE